MRVRVGDDLRRGHAIDLRERDLAIQAVANAIRTCGPDAISIDCPTPGPAHSHVGVIRTDLSLSVRSALAAAARSHGRTAPQADELAEIQDRLDTLDAPEIDLTRARRRVAEASDEESELGERVATLQGRVQALRETGDEATEETESERVETAEDELAEATRRLSEVETERIAAEQALGRAREQAKQNRDRRRERLRLQDRADNLRRAAREHLAETVRESFAEAREQVPDGTGANDDGGTNAETALAVALVAEMDAPVLLAFDVDSSFDADPFESAEQAARWLDAPVIRL